MARSATILEERKRYDPAEVEARIFERWRAAGIFSPADDGDADTYSIAIPPPNVTGVLHMGHALNHTIQDVLIRVARMKGLRTKWILGTDHAGIATQVQVEKLLAGQGTSRQEIGREAFVGRVWEWRAEYGSSIVKQFERLGASVDYADERFTMDEAYARAVAHVFVALFEKGHIYRDNYLVNWDPGTRSAISDLEVEQREVEDHLYEIDYPLASGSGSITIATVRPETMLADVAIAVNPADERYTRLIGEHAILPLVGRRLPIIADDHVDIEFGTGALKITPGHDPNDFEIGRKHGLPEIGVIGEDGCMTADAGEDFAGMTADEARTAVVSTLRDQGLISAERPYTHDVPHSHRSGMRIEPLVSLQWFCDMTELARPAIAAVEDGTVRFHPDRPWKKVYLDWLESIRPWCVSRQLWWGHRLPVWHCDACDETFVAESPPKRCGSCDGELRQDPDVLDTWFSSALWPFATLGWPEETAALEAFYPTNVLSTARDIIFLWVARMVMMGIEFTGRAPFADVNIHSVIQAPDGRRMSKSLGTGIDPIHEIDEFGADALRFGLLAMSSSQDVRFSREKVKQGQDLANKLWNASRLVLTRVEDVEPAPRPETVEDRWMLSRVEHATAAIGDFIATYDLSHAALELYGAFWNEFCDWYLELVKPRLYDEEADRGDLSATLLYVLGRIVTLMHPVMPFVTEEIWSLMGSDGEDAALLAAAPWPEADESLFDPGAEAEVGRAIEAITAVRRLRDQAGVPVGAVLDARIEAEGYERMTGAIGRLARLALGSTEPAADWDTIAIPGGAIRVATADEAGAAAVAERVEQLRAELQSEVARAEGKLSNASFVERAPAPVVQVERDKLDEYRRRLVELDADA